MSAGIVMTSRGGGGRGGGLGTGVRPGPEDSKHTSVCRSGVRITFAALRECLSLEEVIHPQDSFWSQSKLYGVGVLGVRFAEKRIDHV